MKSMPSVLMLILVLILKRNYISSLSLSTIPTELKPPSDIINAGYEQCKPSNEVCSTNNDCCSNCCTSFTYSAMTCQDECPENHNAVHNEDKMHGNIVWKGKQECQTLQTDRRGSQSEVGDKVISRQHRENKNLDEKTDSRTNGHISSQQTKSVKKVNSMDLNNKQTEKSVQIGEFVVKQVETKQNTDIGVRISDEAGNNSSEKVTKARENIEVGLSVIDASKGGKEEDDSGENKNTDIGTAIIKIGEKSKEKQGKQMRDFDVNRKQSKQKGPNVLKDSNSKVKDEKTYGKEVGSSSHSNKDLGGDIITIKTANIEKKTDKDQSFNNLKVRNNISSLEIKGNPTSGDLKDFHNSKNSSDLKVILENAKDLTVEIKSTVTKGNNSSAVAAPCLGDQCHSGQSFVHGIQKVLTMPLNPTLFLPTTIKTPVCKSTGSTCKHPGQCCSQCCAVSDGVFKCFDKTTDECQSSLPGATSLKCKKPGDQCETHGECCLNKCTDCGHSSKCDNELGNICRLEVKQLASNSKLCKHLGDICGEASECCTQCCAVSGGVFKCFEEGTHECQPGDNVSNTTISELVEVVGFAN